MVPQASGESVGRAPALTGSLDAAVLRRGARTWPWYVDVWIQMLRRKPLGTIGLVIVLAMLASAALADWITPYGFAACLWKQAHAP